MKRIPLPTVERLREIFNYDPYEGVLRWKERRPGVNKNLIAGIPCRPGGHVVVRIGKQLFPAHRIIWKIVTGQEPPDYIDHIDMNRTNNKWANLRTATNSQNMMNVGLIRSNTSGYKNVYWHAQSGKWMVSVKLNGKSHSFGLYTTKEDAVKVARFERVRLHGEFARAA
jgi:hypothetical protein